MDIQMLAHTISTLLTPFLPYLIKSGKTASDKLTDVIAQKGGEVIWKKANEIWEKIETYFGDDPEVKGAALIASAKPENGEKQKILEDILVVRLQENPILIQEFLDLLNNGHSIQLIDVNRNSSATNITQELSGNGEQIIKLDNKSRIQNAKQIKK